MQQMQWLINRRVAVAAGLAAARRVAVAAGLAAASWAQAANVTWTGAVSDDWSNPANWSPETVPGANDTAIFGAAATTVVEIDGNQQVGKLTFTPSGGPYRLYGDRLTLNTGGVELLAVAGDDYIFDCQLRLTSDASFNLSNNDLYLNQPLSTSQITVIKDGTGTLHRLGVSDNYPSNVQLFDIQEGDVRVVDNWEMGSDLVQMADGTRLYGDVLWVNGLQGSGEIIATESFYCEGPYNGPTISSSAVFVNDVHSIITRQILTGDNADFGGTLDLLDVTLPVDFGLNSPSAIVRGTLHAAAGTPPLTLSASGRAGILQPGTANNTIGTARPLGLTCNGSAEITLDISSTTSFDKVLVSGAASLNGDLNVGYLHNYVPSSGDSFVILTADSLSGTFSQINTEGVYPWVVDYDYDAGTVTLRVDCSGGVDCDADGVDDNCEPDSDNDGVIDDCDQCEGFDDALDSDSDGVADGCDVCLGDDALGDRDSDGVCDDLDVCTGADDNGPDSDGDGIPDDCQTCETAAPDANNDSDVDLDDLSGFDTCLQGPWLATSVGCDCFDYNDDLQLSMADFAVFQSVFRDTMQPEGIGEVNLFNIKVGYSDKGVAIYGENQGDLSAFSVGLLGDLNDDGFGELMIGAPSYGTDNEEQAGRSYVIWGGNTFGNSMNLADVASGNGGYAIDGQWGNYGHPYTVQEVDQREADPDFQNYAGGPQGGGLGFAVGSAGDVNGDGIEDLMLSAPYAPANGEIWGGRTYVIYGGEQDGTQSPYSIETIMNQGEGLIVVGESGICAGCSNDTAGQDGDLSGASIDGGGDFNGDGLADIFIGAPYHGNRNKGAGYVVFGSQNTTPIDLANLGNRGLSLDRQGGGQGYGHWARMPRDMDGDGFSEAYLSAGLGIGFLVHGRDINGVEQVGFGSSDPNFVSLLLTGDIDCDDSDCEGRFNLFHASDAGGDFNGDGQSDWVGATRSVNNDLYEILIFFDQPTPGELMNGDDVFGPLPTPFETPLNGVRIVSTVFDAISFFVDMDMQNDVNGDGFDDLLFSAGGGGIYQTFLIFGAEGNRTIDLDNLAYGVEGYRLYDRNGGTDPGQSISTSGDLNGDGLYDIAIGAPRDDIGANNTGTAYVVYGTDFTGTVTHMGDAGNNSLSGGPDFDSMIGGLGADALLGGGGPDALYAGAGDDTITVADSNFRRVDGGAGYDTLKIGGIGTLDATAVRGRIRSIEKIDLQGGGPDELIIQRIDVLNMSPTTNVLWVEADAEDIVRSEGEAWTSMGNIFPSVRGYQIGNAQLWVSQAADMRLSPVIDTTSIDVAENTPGGTPIARISASDPDGDGIASMGFVDGLGTFSFNPFTRDVLVVGPIDYETVKSYNVVFRVIDNDGSVGEQTIRINVQPINEAPTLVGLPITATMSEHEPAGRILGSFLATDVDEGDVPGFEIVTDAPSLTSPAPAGAFGVDPNGLVTVRDAGRLDYEAASTIEFLVYAVDQGGLRSAESSLVTVNLTNVDRWTFPIEGTFITTNASMWGTDSATGPDPLGFEERVSLNGSPTYSTGLLGASDFEISGSGAVDVSSTLTMDRGSVNVAVPVVSSISVPDEVELGQPFSLGLVIGHGDDLPVMTGTTLSADFDLLIDFDELLFTTSGPDFGPYNSSNSTDTLISSSTPTVWEGNWVGSGRIESAEIDTELLAADDIDWDEYLLQFLQLAGMPSNEGTTAGSFGGADWLIEYIVWDITLGGSVDVRQELAFQINGYDTILVLENGTQIPLPDPNNTITLPLDADSDGDGYVDFQVRMDLDQTFENYSDFYGTYSKSLRLGRFELTGQIPGCASCVVNDVAGPMFDGTFSVDIAVDEAGVPGPWPTGETGMFPLGGFNTIVASGSFDLSN